MSKKNKKTDTLHTEVQVLPYYKVNSRFKNYPDAIPNPNILFYTGNSGMRVDTVQFYKMLVRKDAEVRTAINVRKLAVTSADWIIEPADENKEASLFSGMIEDMFKNRITSLRSKLNQMMDAIITGYNIHEIITELDEKGNEVLKDLLYRNADRFEFGTDGSFYLIDGQYSTVDRMKRRKLNPKHFLIHTNGSNSENPYGESVLGEASFWLYYLKNGNWKDWAQFNERFGQGILKGEYERGNIKAMEQTFEALRHLRSNGYAVFEKGSNIEILEAGRNTGDYQTFMLEINKAITKMILGQELTTTTGSGTGSYSLGKVHQSTFDNIVKSDRQNLELTMNSLIINILKRSFPKLNRFPKFKFVENKEKVNKN